MLKIVRILADLRKEISEIRPCQGGFWLTHLSIYRYLDISLVKRAKINIVISRFCCIARIQLWVLWVLEGALTFFDAFRRSWNWNKEGP